MRVGKGKEGEFRKWKRGKASSQIGRKGEERGKEIEG